MMFELLKFIPLIYINLVCNNKCLKLFTNLGYLSYFIINYRYEIIDYILLFKIKLNNYLFPIKDYSLIKIQLYKNLNNYIDVTEYFHNKNIDKIDKYVIIDLFCKYSICFDQNDDIRLKIYFSYKNIYYILYYDYSNSYHIPYPPYSDKILEDYKKDIILPKYSKEMNKKYFYYLFMVESKNINIIKVNDKIREDLNLYFEMIKTPFNDFGILYGSFIKLRWILAENGYDLNNFKSLYLKFLNLYLDETNMDLKEHIIEFNKDDLNRDLMSNRMESILLLKKSEED
jgi:hypothetical protein